MSAPNGEALEVVVIDGTYNVEAKTPLGKKKGTLVLATDGEVCNAKLSVMGKTKDLKGTIEGDLVTFEGSVHMPFPFGNVNYVLSGTVDGDVLTGVCKTKKFKFNVNGTRVS